jgi:hypothetical protein
MTAATVLATIVQLLAVFKQERGAKAISDRAEFFEWLVNHRFESLKDFIANSTTAQVEVDNLLRQDLAAILDKLSEIKEVLSPPRRRVEIIARPGTYKDVGYDAIRLQVWFHNPGPGTVYDASVVYTLPKNIMTPEPSSVWKLTRSGYEGTAIVAERAIHENEMVPSLMRSWDSSAEMGASCPTMYLFFALMSFAATSRECVCCCQWGSLKSTRLRISKRRRPPDHSVVPDFQASTVTREQNPPR